jgi:hypothetical protein
MNHWNYVAIAYIGFAILLLWDFIVPQLTLKKSMRTIALRIRRKKSL